MISKSKAVAGAILLVILTSLATYALAVPSRQYVDDSEFAKLSQILDLVEKRFVEESKVDRQRLIEGAAAGVLKALDDPYSSYMTPTEYREFTLRTSGSYSGVGMTIGVKDKYVTVIAPIKGTPAERAGIRPGDRILRVDGVDVYDRPSDEVAAMIRGKEGTRVTLTLVRPPSNIPFEVELVRASIQVPAADARMLEPDIGYLQIFTFNEQASREVASYIEELMGKGAKALVLDLRNNGGGYLTESIAVAGIFVPAGPVVSVTGRDRSQTYQSNTRALGLPLAVLVNEGTASASEIVAGAIQDRGAGIIIGTQTFGKGSVQNIILLADDSGVRLTTDYYYTPSGRSIQGVGITPDIIVEARVSHTVPVIYQKTLGAGAIDVVVLEVQKRLSRLGYRVDADGVMSTAAVEVIQAFQKNHSLPVTGEIDQATVDAVNLAIAELEKANDPQLEKAVTVLRESLGR